MRCCRAASACEVPGGQLSAKNIDSTLINTYYTRKNSDSTRKFDIIDPNKYPFNTYFNMAFYILNIYVKYSILYHIYLMLTYLNHIWTFSKNHTFSFRLLFLRDIGLVVNFTFFLVFGRTLIPECAYRP